MIRLTEVLDTVPFEYLRWGCRAGDFSTHLASGDPSDGFEVVEQYDNIKSSPDAQTLGSCTCNAFTGLMEWWIYKTHGRAVQLDYNTLYDQVRSDRGDMSDTGATLDAPFVSARLHGWLPFDTGRIRIGIDTHSICQALKVSPMVIAMSVHSGWSPSNLNPENGAVAEDKAYGLSRGTNGHAMLMIGTNEHNHTPLTVIRNSWGPLGQGGHGLTCCSLNHYLSWAIDRALQIVPSSAWGDWTGWEQYVLAEG